jgi:hypothetical protein
MGGYRPGPEHSCRAVPRSNAMESKYPTRETRTRTDRRERGVEWQNSCIFPGQILKGSPTGQNMVAVIENLFSTRVGK